MKHIFSVIALFSAFNLYTSDSQKSSPRYHPYAKPTDRKQKPINPHQRDTAEHPTVTYLKTDALTSPLPEAIPTTDPVRALTQLSIAVPANTPERYPSPTPVTVNDEPHIENGE